MAFDDRICWLVQAGARARYAEDFVTGSIVSVGWDWPGIGDLATADDAEVFLTLEGLGRRKPADDLRDLRIFSGRMGEGDVLVVPDPPAEDLLFGQVVGDYAYRAGGGAHRHTRPVRWFGRLGLDQAEALLVATALRVRQPIRRLPEQLRWQRLAGEVDDVLGRPADDVRHKPARAVGSRTSTAPRTRASTAAPKATPIPERICPACGLMRSPSLFDEGDDVCRDCA